MIVSETRIRVKRCRPIACALLCAMVACSFAATHAQDYEAVGKRLKAAVEARELTAEQARAMLAVLKKAAATKGQDDDILERLESIGKRLKAAVERGDLSEEEAWAKWFEIKENRIAPRLKTAVKAGEMSEEEAWAIWREIEKGEAAARLKRAVEKGEISEEEARAKWAEINKEAGDKDDGEGEEHGDAPADDEEEPDDDAAEVVKPVPAELANAIGAALLKVAPVDFPGDPASAVGLVAVNDDEKPLGIILVPPKGMNEEETPDMTVAGGVPTALLFSSPSIVPMVDGKLIDRGKLHSVTVTDDDGDEHEANCMLLTVRRISDEDYRLYVFGKADKPMIDARFTVGKGPGDTPLALGIKDVDPESKSAAVVITVFDKYQAAFRAGVAE